jgi:tubulin polyglutamylase TTLL1
MKKIACIAIESVFISIDPNRLNNTFEVFGLDFMIDANFKVYLIEINTNPDITACCTLLQRLIPTMIFNSLNIVVDSLFPPPDIILAKKNKLYVND